MASGNDLTKSDNKPIPGSMWSKTHDVIRSSESYWFSNPDVIWVNILPAGGLATKGLYRKCRMINYFTPNKCIWVFLRNNSTREHVKNQENYLPIYRLPLSFMVISDVYRSLITNKTIRNKHCSEEFEVHWVGQYLVNFTSLAGTVKATVSKTEAILTGLRHGKSS